MSIKNVLKISVLIIIFVFTAENDAQVNRETRAVWIATNFRLDWPPPTFNADEQKSAILEILNNLKRNNFNTIYFQIRSNGVVLFNSSHEPLSPHLTGIVNGDPGYDPLTFVIEESHKRGMEIHAWANMARCFSGSETEIFNDTNHISKKKPEWIVRVNGNGSPAYWLDPGLPEVKNYLASLLEEVVINYDIDGIHLDFLRYPDKDFKDDTSFKMYGNGKDRDDWRRENITSILQEIFYRTKAIKPWVKVGIAPFGIYKNIKGAVGTQGFSDVYQDRDEWLRREIVDYIAPQIYWPFDSNPDFGELAKDWVENGKGKNIILGIAPYKPEVYSQLNRVISFSREVNASGIAFFRYGNIKNYDFSLFREKSYPSPMPWIDKNLPPAPINLLVTLNKNNFYRISLSWEMPEIDKTFTKPVYFALYNFPTKNFAFNSENLFEVIQAKSPKLSMAITRPRYVNYYFGLKSIDKLWNESEESSNIVHVKIDELSELSELNRHKSDPVLFKNTDNSLHIILFENREDQISILGVGDFISSQLGLMNVGKGYNIIEIEPNDFESITIDYANSGKKKTLKIN